MKKLIRENQFMKLWLWPAGEKILLPEPLLEMRPTAMHIQPAGAVGDRPSVVIALEHPALITVVYGQISYSTLKDLMGALEDADRAQLEASSGVGSQSPPQGPETPV